MKTQTGPVERQKFYQLHQEGQTYTQISALYGVSPMCVRYWCRKQARGETVEDHYYNPRAGTLSQFDGQVAQTLLQLRQDHPKWGPASLALHLPKQPAVQGLALPSRATIGRFLHTFPEYRHTRKKKNE